MLCIELALAWGCPPLHRSNPLCMTADARTSMAGGSWLITGGLGGLGQLFAHWAAGNGAEHLCLLDTQLGSLPEWLAGAPSGLGAVTILRGDVGTAEDARAALLATNQRQGRALSGVMHAAGVLQVCSLHMQIFLPAALQKGCRKTLAACIQSRAFRGCTQMCMHGFRW
jgi:NAD(P)-dependent dehydrogenase (short-subunit alcohol dehydrogenase family)